MSLDVYNASMVAGGESSLSMPPLEVRGLEVIPAVETLSSQLTGDTDSVLTIAYKKGAVRMFGYVKEFQQTELTLISTSGEAHMTAGQAQWYTLCAVQHRNAGAISVIAVAGTIAAFASVAKLTFAEILAALGKGDADANVVILGDARFYRSADTVMEVAVDGDRRGWFVDEADKTMLGVKTTADVSTLNEVYGGFMDFPVDLTTLSGVTPGNLAVDGADLPKWPFGGTIQGLEYIGTVDGANSGADITLKAQIDGTAVTDSDLNLTLANTAVPSTVDGSTPSANDSWAPGDGFDIEVDAVDTAFTAGSGIVRVHLGRYE
jgi:hypothetical protein